MRIKRRHITGFTLLGLSLMIIGVAAYQVSPARQRQIEAEQQNRLNDLWRAYKQAYVDANTGRTIDPARDNITTSEGQSYTMLRAVWSDDKATFDHTWNWTKSNLKRQDNLFSWLYGTRADGSTGIITEQGGENTASDADIDIAIALLFAANRWNDPSYLEEARPIIASIWSNEVVVVGGKPYLAANNLEKQSADYALINPSYFAPYAFRIFAEVDPENPWEELAQASYDLLEESMDSSLDTGSTAQLPPNWVVLNKKTGQLTASPARNLDTNYGYDALRIPWRLALDHKWYGASEADNLLEKMSFFAKEWKKHHRLAAVYSHSGKIVGDYEVPALYATSLTIFDLTTPRYAKQIYQTKILPILEQDITTLSYYDNNWLWFSLSDYYDNLPNLSNQSH